MPRLRRLRYDLCLKAASIHKHCHLSMVFQQSSCSQNSPQALRAQPSSSLRHMPGIQTRDPDPYRGLACSSIRLRCRPGCQGSQLLLSVSQQSGQDGAPGLVVPQSLPHGCRVGPHGPEACRGRRLQGCKAALSRHVPVVLMRSRACWRCVIAKGKPGTGGQHGSCLNLNDLVAAHVMLQRAGLCKCLGILDDI